MHRILARTGLDVITDAVLASFAERPEFQPLRAPRDELHAWVSWNLELMLRWFDGQPPTDAELERFRELARLVHARVYAPLGHEHAELARTLDSLIEHDFDRGETAASLPVHRNTLTKRLERISTLTGVDLDTAEGCGLAWLAWLSAPERSPAAAGRRVASQG